MNNTQKSRVEHHINQNITINQLRQFEVLTTELIEYYCALTASGTKLSTVKHKGVFLFKQDLISDKKFTNEQIGVILLSYTKQKCAERKLDYNAFNNYFRPTLKKIHSYFFGKVNIINGGGVISKEFMEGMQSGNLDLVESAVKSVQKSAKEALNAIENRKTGLKNLEETRQSKLDQYRQENSPFGSRIKQKIDNILDYFVPVNATDLLIQKIAYGFVEDDIEIKSKADLNKYYGNESGLTNTPENLQKLFDCYLVEKDFYERTKIRPSIKLEIIKIAQNAKQKGNTFLNDVQRENFLLNNLKGKTDNITKQMVKLFVDNLK